MPAPVDDVDGVDDVDDVARRLFGDALSRTAVVRVGLALTIGAGRELAFTASDRDHSDGVDWCTIDGLADVPLTRAVRTGVPVRVPDPRSLERLFPAMAQRQLSLGVQALVAYPLLRRADVVGAVLLSYDRPWRPQASQLSSDDEVVREVAAALEQAHDRRRAAALGTDGRGPLRLPNTEAVHLGQHHPLAGLPDAGAHWVEAIDPGDGCLVLASGHTIGVSRGDVERVRRALRDRVAAGGRQPVELLGAVDGVATVALLEPSLLRMTSAASSAVPRLLVRSGDGVLRPARSGARELCPDDVVVLWSSPDPDERQVREAAGRLARESSEPKLLALRLGQVVPHCGSVLVARVAGRASGRRDLLELPHDPTSPGAARRWAAQLAHEWGVGSLAPDLQACVSELCTNAFMHSATPVRVVLSREGGALVLVVHNGGVSDVTRPGAADPEDVGGRGLLLVEALSDAWGWHVGAEGTTVWCRLPVVEPATAPVRSAAP